MPIEQSNFPFLDDENIDRNPEALKLGLNPHEGKENVKSVDIKETDQEKKKRKEELKKMFDEQQEKFKKETN